MDKVASFEFILDSVFRAAGETLGLRPHQLGPGRRIAGLGLEPAAAEAFEAELRDSLGAEIPEGWLFKDARTFEDLAREIRLLSNAAYLFKQVYINDTALENAYIGTETGISYRYSIY
ncbi:MAG: hypothetical protein LBW85_10730, partial [Deltaproteobacteria bacterium]|nr:hypothetical protein [Deltaproteobacteria bacterium]